MCHISWFTVPGAEPPKLPTVSKQQPTVVMDKPEVDLTQTDDSLSYPVRGGRLAKMIDVPRAAMSPWESAAQFGGSVEQAFEHIDAYREASSHVTFDDFVDDEIVDTFSVQPAQSQSMSVSILISYHTYT